MAIPEIAGVSLTHPYVIRGAVAVIIVFVGGTLGWLAEQWQQ